MGSAWRVGKLLGIRFQIHWTFLLLPLWIFGSSLWQGVGVESAGVSVLFLLSVFGCVVLHELGHAMMARQFGISTRDITLLPIGGVANLARMPRHPFQEFAIAVAGPAVNVVIAVALVSGIVATWGGLPSAVGSFIVQLAWVNVALVLFNLIPAFPMDGGRILRSLLAVVMPYRNATHIAVGVGQIAATGLGILGLVGGNFMLVALAAFVFLAAASEATAVNQPITEVMPPCELHLPLEAIASASYPSRDNASNESRPMISGSWDAKSAQRWMDRKSNHEFVVVKDGVAIGVLNKNDLTFAIRSGDGRCPIERLLVMTRGTRVG